MPRTTFPLRLTLAGAVAVFTATTVRAETIDPINDLRFGATIQMAPTVSEEIDGKRYNWKGGKVWGLRYDALYVQGMSRRGRPLAGFIWATGLSYGETNITPGSFDTGSGESTNTRDDITLKYKQYGVALGGGWATVPSPTELGDFHWEILAIGRGGYATAQTIAPGLRATRGDGGHAYSEAGAQAGFELCDEHWIFGMHVGWLYGKTTIPIDLPDNIRSDLTIIRNGAELGANIGFRF